MTTATVPVWHEMRTDETRAIEDGLRAEFERVESYRYSCASIRIRVVDPRFEGLSDLQRHDLVRGYFNRLPKRKQVDLIVIFPLTPAEMEPDAEWKTWWPIRNREFEHPSPSEL